jgi:hypothetical protein
MAIAAKGYPNRSEACCPLMRASGGMTPLPTMFLYLQHIEHGSCPLATAITESSGGGKVKVGELPHGCFGNPKRN